MADSVEVISHEGGSRRTSSPLERLCLDAIFVNALATGTRGGALGIWVSSTGFVGKYLRWRIWVMTEIVMTAVFVMTK
ncbi:hypothetical protein HFV02_04515 [Acidithiobacillus caldus]|nr:hypothetical protein [Acidithiobacillus caldus]